MYVHNVICRSIYFFFTFYALLVFNIVNNIEVDETKQTIEQYRRENKDQISKGRNKKVILCEIFLKS